MNLINLFDKNRNTEKKEVFLAIEIQESLIKSISWQIVDGSASVLDMGSFEAWTNEENLVNGVNNSISEAVKNLQDLPDRVIFGLPHSWLKDDAIHPSKEPIIKQVVRSLSLQPIGVVTTTQAIIHQLKHDEGVPPSIILLENYTTKIAVSLVQVGKLIATEEVGLSGDLCHDIEEALARIEYDTLPSRFVLSNDATTVDDTQHLISYGWTDKLPFLHAPKVETLPFDFSIKAIALSGGQEAVVGSTQTSQTTTPTVVTATSVVDEPSSQVLSDMSNVSIPDPNTLDLSELGFTYDQIDPPGNVESGATVVEDLSLPESDVVINENLVNNNITHGIVTSVSPQTSHKTVSFTRPSLLKIKHLLVIPLVIFLLFVGSFVYYYFGGKSLIRVVTNSGSHQSQLQVVFSPSASTSSEVTAEIVQINKTGSSTIKTTGDTTVGDKSTGKINIYNGTATSITLKSGTPVKSEIGELVFYLSQDVTIASMSSEFDSVVGEEKKTYGRQTEIPLTASRIGAEYNLAKNTKFTIDNYSKTVTYGILDSDTTGGSSRAVRAANKADQDKLIAQLQSELSTSISTELNLSSDQDYVFMSDPVVSNKKFNKGLGEEAEELSLDLTLSQDVLIFSKTSFFQYLAQSQKSLVRPGYSMVTEKSTYTLTDLKKVSSTHVAGQVSFSAPLIPIIDTTDIVKQSQGALRSKVRDLIQSLPGYEDSTLIVSPNLWPFSELLIPKNNLTIELTTK